MFGRQLGSVALPISIAAVREREGAERGGGRRGEGEGKRKRGRD